MYLIPVALLDSSHTVALTVQEDLDITVGSSAPLVSFHKRLTNVWQKIPLISNTKHFRQK